MDQEGIIENQQDILLNIYKEHLTQARHQENQRSTMTNLILIICTGAIGIITFDNSINFYDLPLVLFIIFSGIYGSIFSAKYYERFKLHYERSREVRIKLISLFNELELSEMQRKADEKTQQNFPLIFNLRLYWLWISLFLLVSSLGLFILIYMIITNS